MTIINTSKNKIAREERKKHKKIVFTVRSNTDLLWEIELSL